jgi:hypothetical protein
MARDFTASTKLALFLVAALFVFNVYRAALCDVTPDEAWNYDRYVAPSWQESLRQFDTNNHFINTLLVCISTDILGRKEIALRLPSLLAGLLYCWAAWRLSRRLYGRGWGFAAAVALLTLNPVVADALSEARGYGMAMAGWLWALDAILLYLEELDVRKLNRAGFCLALSVASCVTFIVPVLGLAVAATWAAGWKRARDLWLPMQVLLFVLLVIPLNRVLLSDFASGATSLRQTLAELTALSLGTLPVNPRVLAGVMRIAAGLLLAAGAVVVVRRGRRDPILSLTTGTALFGFVFLLVAHARIKTPFPQRGAVYFIPILTLIGLALVRRRPGLMAVPAIACILVYAAGLPVGAYLDGREFAGSRELAKAIRSDAGQRAVGIAASPALEPVINYYRARYRQGNWERVQHKAPERGYQYFALTAADAGLVERFQLRVLRRFPGMVLAVR